MNWGLGLPLSMDYVEANSLRTSRQQILDSEPKMAVVVPSSLCLAPNTHTCIEASWLRIVMCVCVCERERERKP